MRSEGRLCKEEKRGREGRERERGARKRGRDDNNKKREEGERARGREPYSSELEYCVLSVVVLLYGGALNVVQAMKSTTVIVCTNIGTYIYILLIGYIGIFGIRYSTSPMRKALGRVRGAGGGRHYAVR